MESFYFSTKEELDSFIKQAADERGAEFLQSWLWGALASTDEADIRRMGVRHNDGKGIVAAATMIRKKLGSYSYWYAPRGPIFSAGLPDERRKEAITCLIRELRMIDPRAAFFRVEPPVAINVERLKMQKTIELQPKKTLIVDLERKEEDILKGMHQKTRYNINLAAKKGVEIWEGNIADFPEFWRLMGLTGERDAFRLHGEAHYRKLLSGGAPAMKLFFARYQKKNIAAGLFCLWGDKATYMHGASDNEFRNVMAPYLLQWSMMKLAKANGCKYYDFYGIDAKKWPGVTRFKLGFGGRTEEYPGTYDIILKPAIYGVYSFLRKLKRFYK